MSVSFACGGPRPGRAAPDGEPEGRSYSPFFVFGQLRHTCGYGRSCQHEEQVARVLRSLYADTPDRWWQWQNVFACTSCAFCETCHTSSKDDMDPRGACHMTLCMLMWVTCAAQPLLSPRWDPSTLTTQLSWKSLPLVGPVIRISRLDLWAQALPHYILSISYPPSIHPHAWLSASFSWHTKVPLMQEIDRCA